MFSISVHMCTYEKGICAVIQYCEFRKSIMCNQFKVGIKL